MVLRRRVVLGGARRCAPSLTLSPKTVALWTTRPAWLGYLWHGLARRRVTSTGTRKEINGGMKPNGRVFTVVGASVSVFRLITRANNLLPVSLAAANLQRGCPSSR